MDGREMLDRAAEELVLAEKSAGDPELADRCRARAQLWATMAQADATLRLAAAIGHVTHRGAILTQQRGG